MEREDEVRNFYRSESEGEDEESGSKPECGDEGATEVQIESTEKEEAGEQQVETSEEVEIESAKENSTEDIDLQLRLSDDDDEVAEQPKTDKPNLITDVIKRLSLPSNPRLSGGPDQSIDLTGEVVTSSGISKLMDRYLKHALPQKAKHNKLEIE